MLTEINFKVRFFLTYLTILGKDEVNIGEYLQKQIVLV